jgi:AP-1 complex subunit beta-1
VIPAQDSLIGDLLSMDIGGPTIPAVAAPVTQSAFGGGAMDLLGGGLDTLVSCPNYILMKVLKHF